MNKYNTFEKILIYSGILVFMTFILLPFVEMFYASLRPLDHLFRSPYQFYSDDLSFWAYREMWNTVPMLGRYIFNSFFLATSVAVITLIFVIPAAYSYARFKFPAKNTSLYVLLAINMFSGAVLLIPLYKVLRTFGLLNSYQAMIVPGVAFLIPTSIWLLKSYFEKIPIDLEEAAFVDGASRVQILRHIIAPLSTPGLVVVGIYAFIGAYAQQFLFAITFNQKKEYMPIPSGLYEFIGYQSVKWNEMMAASLVGIAPVLLVFIFLQKYIVEGLTAGAVKN
ncbi:carbohydrate ABC transporter permease [Pelagibacteraceae bacterium]|jgi:multiple sugar transport system permease protein|nr:carbohydrate ABC transporter permease [Pelagibacteraceae bacterium]|tara:strand:- start:79 stop:918 length:840 start_codon:yes stop_codon:yes gene_type:complete